MTKQDIIDVLMDILKAGTMGRINSDRVDANTDLIVDMGLDSIEALDILLRAEERFGIIIEDEDLNRDLFRTVGAFAEYVANKYQSCSNGK